MASTTFRSFRVAVSVARLTREGVAKQEERRNGRDARARRNGGTKRNSRGRSDAARRAHDELSISVSIVRHPSQRRQCCSVLLLPSPLFLSTGNAQPPSHHYADIPASFLLMNSLPPSPPVRGVCLSIYPPKPRGKSVSYGSVNLNRVRGLC